MLDPNRLFEIIESRSDELVAILRDLLRFETVSGVTDPTGLKKFQRETLMKSATSSTHANPSNPFDANSRTPVTSTICSGLCLLPCRSS